MKLTEKMIKMSEGDMRIKLSSVNAANIQQFIDNIDTHIRALENTTHHVSEEDKQKLEGLKRNLVDAMKHIGVEFR